MNKLILSSKVTVTQIRERDMDNYFYLSFEKEGSCTSVRLQKPRVLRQLERQDVACISEKYIGKVALHCQRKEGDAWINSVIYLHLADAEAVIDYMMKRKLHLFTFSEFETAQESGRFEKGFWGKDFILPYSSDADAKDVGIYEYAHAYVKTNQDLEREAKEAQIESERDAAAAKAQAEAEILGLPALKGSAKQVRWAEQLRAKYFAKTRKENLAPRCRSVKTAKWWINKRFELGIEQKKERNQWGNWS